MTLIIVLGTFVGACATGLEPPAPTVPVYLAGQTFEMGTRVIDPCGRFYVDECSARTCPTVLPADDTAESERIVHQRVVKPFCIDAHEVTLKQYRHCYARGIVRALWSVMPVTTSPEMNHSSPTIGMIQTAMGIILWLEYPGRAPKPTVDFAVGGSLTETEWEFAAKSGGQVHGPADYIWSDSDLAANINIGCGDFQNQLALGSCSRSLRP